MNIEKILILSTGHVPSKDNFNFDSTDGVDVNMVRYTTHQYGWIVFVSDSWTEHSAVPLWLRPILRYASRHNCSHINFDRDADKMDFQIYNW